MDPSFVGTATSVIGDGCREKLFKEEDVKTPYFCSFYLKKKDPVKKMARSLCSSAPIWKGPWDFVFSADVLLMVNFLCGYYWPLETLFSLYRCFASFQRLLLWFLFPF